MIKITPEITVIIPIIILGVNCSWKNTTPKNKAVRGSSEPSIAVVVEPISFIAIFIVSIEIIVGNNAKPIAYSHNTGDVSGCNSVQKFKFVMYTKSPKNIT